MEQLRSDLMSHSTTAPSYRYKGSAGSEKLENVDVHTSKMTFRIGHRLEHIREVTILQARFSPS